MADIPSQFLAHVIAVILRKHVRPIDEKASYRDPWAYEKLTATKQIRSTNPETVFEIEITLTEDAYIFVDANLAYSVLSNNGVGDLVGFAVYIDGVAQQLPDSASSIHDDCFMTISPQGGAGEQESSVIKACSDDLIPAGTHTVIVAALSKIDDAASPLRIGNRIMSDSDSTSVCKVTTLRPNV